MDIPNYDSGQDANTNYKQLTHSQLKKGFLI